MSTFDIIVIAVSMLAGYSLPQPLWAKVAQDWVIKKIYAYLNKKRS